MTAKRTSKRAASRRAAKPVARRNTSAEPVVEYADVCARGKHPVSRRLGAGCAACGKPNAWGK